MRKIVQITVLVLLTCFLGCAALYIDTGLRGAESPSGRVMEAVYPLWGWAAQFLVERNLIVPGLGALDEIRGRWMASKAYLGEGWYFIGGGYSSDWLVGIEPVDRPLRGLPELDRCDAYREPLPETDEEMEEYWRKLESLPPWESGGLGQGTPIICHLRSGETVEFLATIEGWSCIVFPWMKGLNRKTIELLVADDNWPPQNDDRRMTRQEFARKLGWLTESP